MTHLTALHDAVRDGDAAAAEAVTRAALGEGVEPMKLVSEAMIPAMDRVGQLFDEEEYFVPELLLSARAMKASLALIQPLLAARGVEPTGRVVIGTVRGDLHDIGKNLVAYLLEGGGFEVMDLGVDVPPERFVETVRTSGAEIVCLSALLTVTMPAMKSTIEALEAAGLRDRVRVLVGGAPVSAAYADEIGADGYGENATAAVGLVRRMSGLGPESGQ
jgi:5-methyltetrahydrofolate--homocysteine methyltransferase